MIMALQNHEYRTLATRSIGEFKEKGSRFIGYAQEVTSEEEARTFIEEVRKIHHKARHHCFGYSIGIQEAIERANDDGEPSGTAGRPILGQIHSFSLSNVCVVVVRYFGGVKLGTGGLIQAYKEAARLSLEEAQIVTREQLRSIMISLDYAHAHFLLDAAKKFDIPVISKEYGERALIKIALPPDQLNEQLLRLKAETLHWPMEMAADEDSEAWDVQILEIN